MAQFSARSGRDVSRSYAGRNLKEFFMSESSVVAQANGGAPKISKISEAVIRIAGNSQDGIQAIGGFLARLAGRSEQEVMTFMTIPSTISGGPSIFQVRIGSGEVLSAGDEADVLLAFYQHSYEDHLSSLKKGGIVLYDSDHVEAEAGVAKELSPRRRSDFQPDGRSHRRHGQGQGQKHLFARPDREDVRSERPEAREAHHGTLHAARTRAS